MRILYHLPSLAPRIAGAEAFEHDVAVLREAFGGDLVRVNPNPYNRFIVPRALFGFWRLPALLRHEPAYDAHHIFNPDPFVFPYLRLLRKPVIYSLTGALPSPAPTASLKRMWRVTTHGPADHATLLATGLNQARLLRTGIDLDRFQPSDPPEGPFTLLMASAPWTHAQFESKGLLALLDALLLRPEVRLVLIWRDAHVAAVQSELARRGLGDRATLINARVDIAAQLGQAHAAVLTPVDGRIVKAFPNSLLEALACARPVLASRSLELASFVSRDGCGIVADDVTPAALAAAIDRLRANYPALQAGARACVEREFSLPAMLASFGDLYRELAREPGGEYTPASFHPS